MKKDSLVFALSGMFFGLIAGWIIGTQQAGPVRAPQAQAVQQQTATTTAPMAGSGQAALLDENKVRALENVAAQRPQDAAVRTELGNMYFDAERFADAVRWYEQSLAIEPGNADVSTDLGVSYYYMNQPDKAIDQFRKSLAVNPKHTKTLLNMGIVRAFGKQDLDGAAQAWQQVIALAPDSQEGRAARQALDNMKSAHPEVGSGAGAAGAKATPPQRE
jgi:tetratricopeptide (TPR) repeat protein